MASNILLAILRLLRFFLTRTDKLRGYVTSYEGTLIDTSQKITNNKIPQITANTRR